MPFACFINFDWSRRLSFSLCFVVTKHFKAWVVDVDSGLCNNILIDFNILMGLSYIFVSYSTFVYVEFWSYLLRNSHMIVYDL